MQLLSTIKCSLAISEGRLEKEHKKLILIGAGGHARSVVDIALQNGEYELVGCLDMVPGNVLGIPVIGNDDDLESFYAEGVRYIFVAIGKNQLRDEMLSLTGQSQLVLSQSISSAGMRQSLHGQAWEMELLSWQVQ